MNNYNDFRRALQFVLKWKPPLAIPNPELALNTYIQEYWDKAGCDNLTMPFNLVVFDTAVYCGVNRAVKWARAARTIEEFIRLRRNYYISLVGKDPLAKESLKHWLKHLGDLQKLVTVLAPERASGASGAPNTDWVINTP